MFKKRILKIAFFYFNIVYMYNNNFERGQGRVTLEKGVEEWSQAMKWKPKVPSGSDIETNSPSLRDTSTGLDSETYTAPLRDTPTDSYYKKKYIDCEQKYNKQKQNHTDYKTKYEECNMNYIDKKKREQNLLKRINELESYTLGLNEKLNKLNNLKRTVSPTPGDPPLEENGGMRKRQKSRKLKKSCKRQKSRKLQKSRKYKKYRK